MEFGVEGRWDSGFTAFWGFELRVELVSCRPPLMFPAPRVWIALNPKPET